MTISLKVDRKQPSPDTISQAAKVIKSGGLVAFPTETVYGLGADALNPEAVAKIFKAKGRPSDNPLILHVMTLKQARNLVKVNSMAEKLAEKFWPGPLTLVLPAKDTVPSITRGGLETAAVRMPADRVALSLIEHSGTAIAAPSANISGRPSPTDADTVFSEMNGRIDMILDGGSVIVGIESTVIDITNPSRPLLLRPGGMPREEIESVIGVSLERPDSESKKRSPGTRYRHYAPNVAVKIWHKGETLPENSAYIGIDLPENLDREHSVLFDSEEDYARGLFSAMRKLESENVECINLQWPDDDKGICLGLRDRILRSSGEYV
ncbi:MAG: threonylcarbamoyl-AMP synthase [Synergistaceae bacterium]|nr:threonylcarbamoyl-AMP synthase [Synergistaceae bacterium]